MIRNLTILLFLMLIVTACGSDSAILNNIYSPQIVSITTELKLVQIDHNISLLCSASDLDGDDLTYEWHSNSIGSFESTKGNEVKWKAPSIPGEYKIFVEVSDGTNKTESHISIFVQEGSVDQLHALPCPGNDKIEYEGQTYNTILIGDQCWLKENLNVGLAIEGNVDQANNSVVEKYCLDDNPINCEKYGGFYQWEEAMKYSGNSEIKGICPAGWHIPTREDFNRLHTRISGSNDLKDISEGKAYGTGTNKSGFSAFMAGYRNWDGLFTYETYETYFWTSERNDINAYHRSLYYRSNEFMAGENNPKNGFSIRCLKN